jgi:hypothetical protein
MGLHFGAFSLVKLIKLAKLVASWPPFSPKQPKQPSPPRGIKKQSSFFLQEALESSRLPASGDCSSGLLTPEEEAEPEPDDPCVLLGEPPEEILAGFEPSLLLHPDITKSPSSAPKPMFMRYFFIFFTDGEVMLFLYY